MSSEERRSRVDGAAVPVQWPSPFLLFSPSLLFKGKKITLVTNRRERQSAAACCPLRPPVSPLPCSGPPHRTFGLEKLRLMMRGG